MRIITLFVALIFVIGVTTPPTAAAAASNKSKVTTLKVKSGNLKKK